MNLRIVDYIILSVIVIGLIVCVVLSCSSFIRAKNLKKEITRIFQKNVWLNFIEHIDKFVYVDIYEFSPNMFCHEWKYGNYRILVWVDKENRKIPTSSIHTNNDVVLSSFNQKRSKEMARKLIHKLWKENKKAW